MPTLDLASTPPVMRLEFVSVGNVVEFSDGLFFVTDEVKGDERVVVSLEADGPEPPGTVLLYPIETQVSDLGPLTVKR